MSMRDVQYAWVRRQLGPQGKLVDPWSARSCDSDGGSTGPGLPSPEPLTRWLNC